MSGWVAAELGSRWHTPTVQIFHATGVTKLREQGAADTSPSGRIEVEKAVVRAVDRLIAQCPAERDELLADYGARADQIALIPSAVDTDRFRPVAKSTARQTLEIDPTAEMIVYVGRIVPAQGRAQRRPGAGASQSATTRCRHHHDADALRRRRRYGAPDPVATPEIGVLRALAAELGVLDEVRFVGRRQPDELHLWYAAADVAVTTPWYEPFGLTPLEAMACGTPVIGSRVGGIAFTIADGETGFLVPPRDPEALCARLEEILRDPARRMRMGQAGRARVLSSFTWQQVAMCTAALYDDLLSERFAPSSDRPTGPDARWRRDATTAHASARSLSVTEHQLAQKIALVTGAGSGLGEATARRLAAAGACVTCIDLDEERARSTAEAIDASGSRAIAVGCDVGDERAVQTAVDRTLQTWNRIDIAVNCAGVDYVLGIEEMTVAQWDRVIGVNLRGPFLVAKAVFPVMKQLAGGDIVNVASTAALRAWGNASAYHASKWGLVGFSRGLGVEGRADGIRVTTIIPGGMNTHWFDRFPEQGIPLPDQSNLQDPANVADAIAYAVALPRGSVMQEMLITPLSETSWP